MSPSPGWVSSEILSHAHTVMLAKSIFFFSETEKFVNLQNFFLSLTINKTFCFVSFILTACNILRYQNSYFCWEGKYYFSLDSRHFIFFFFKGRAVYYVALISLELTECACFLSPAPCPALLSCLYSVRILYVGEGFIRHLPTERKKWGDWYFLVVGTHPQILGIKEDRLGWIARFLQDPEVPVSTLQKGKL